MEATPDPWDRVREVIHEITDLIAEHLEEGESTLEYLGEPESGTTVPEDLRAAFQEATQQALGEVGRRRPCTRNRYVYGMVRSELLGELMTYIDDEHLNHVTAGGYQPPTDIWGLSDHELREALMRARAMKLVWDEFDE